MKKNVVGADLGFVQLKGVGKDVQKLLWEI